MNDADSKALCTPSKAIRPGHRASGQTQEDTNAHGHAYAAAPVQAQADQEAQSRLRVDVPARENRADDAEGPSAVEQVHMDPGWFCSLSAYRGQRPADAGKLLKCSVFVGYPAVSQRAAMLCLFGPTRTVPLWLADLAAGANADWQTPDHIANMVAYLKNEGFDSSLFDDPAAMSMLPGSGHAHTEQPTGSKEYGNDETVLPASYTGATGHQAATVKPVQECGLTSEMAHWKGPLGGLGR